MTRHTWVCPNCGGKNVNCTGTLHFDEGKQDWIFEGTPHDDDWCEDCDCEVRAEQVELEDSELTDAQREEIIDKLVEDLLDSAAQSSRSMIDIFRNGFEGFSERTDAELLQNHKDAFDEDFLESEEEDDDSDA